jgi:MinD superfamily P-loop ATPase
VLVVAELCRGCGACVLVCPSGAVEEIGRPVGVVRRGRVGGLLFVDGELAVGEASATPVIAAVKHAIPGGGVAVLDAPPGASCPMVEAVRGADRVILVVEPTPFGLSDLGPAAGAARALGLAPAVVVNRCDVGDAGVHALCEKEGLPIVAEIPYDRAIAEAYAQGVVPSLRSSVLADAVGRIAGELLGAPRTEDAL